MKKGIKIIVVTITVSILVFFVYYLFLRRDFHFMNDHNSKLKDLKEIENYDHLNSENYKTLDSISKNQLFEKELLFYKKNYRQNFSINQRNKLNDNSLNDFQKQKVKEYFTEKFWQNDSLLVFNFTDFSFEKKHKFLLFYNQKLNTKIICVRKFNDNLFGVLLSCETNKDFCFINCLLEFKKSELTIYSIHKHSWSNKFDLYSDQSTEKQIELITYVTLVELITNDTGYFLTNDFELNQNYFHNTKLIWKWS
ncbi:MAG: hypothetical protein ACK5B9_02805 [Flavobacteriia bacterium]|jgi:hypothetical protein